MDIFLPIFVFCTVCLPILIVTAIVLSIFNRLTRLHVLTQEAWSGIDVQLKKRYELIPNIVTTAKGYAAHEKSIFQKVSELRSNAMSAQSPEDKKSSENMLTNTLKSLLAVSESYPELKADAGFLKLQTELAQIERDLEKARRYYNGCVREQNTRIASFPHNLLASVFGFKPAEFFEAEPDQRNNIDVNLSK